MKLRPCPACGNQVSTEAQACPMCAHPLAKTKRHGIGAKLIVGFFCFAIFSVVLENCARMSEKLDQQKETTVAKAAAAPTATPEKKIDPELQKRIKRFGPPPEQSAWDGSYRPIKEYLRAVANDPSSIDIQSCSDVYYHNKDGWIILCDYRGKNAFGGLVLNSNWFVIKNGVVVAAKPPNAYRRR